MLHEHLTYEDAARQVGMSRRQLYRRLRALDDVLAARRAEEERRAKFEMSYENVLALIDPRACCRRSPSPYRTSPSLPACARSLRTNGKPRAELAILTATPAG